MSNETKSPKSRRRAFLKGVVVAGGATAVGAAGASAVADLSVDESTPKAKAEGGKGYHETDHIRDYYRLAQF